MYYWFNIYNFDWIIKNKVLESFSMWIFVIETYYFWLVSLRKKTIFKITPSKVRSMTTQGNMGDSLDVLWSFNNTLPRDCCVCMFERLICNVFLFTLNTIIFFLKVWEEHSKIPATNKSINLDTILFRFLIAELESEVVTNL